MGLEATFNAKELALATTVFFGAMTTGHTGSTGVSGVNDIQADACRFTLVRQKLTQLMERPREPLVTLVLSHRNSLTNTYKVFDCDCPLTSESLLNKMLADAMVHITLIPRLAAAVAPKVLLSGFRPRLLQPRPKTRKLTAALLDAFTCVCLAVAVHGKLYYAEVNSKNVLRVNRRGRRQVNRDVQVKDAVPKNEVCLPFGPVKPRRLVRAIAHRNEFASAQAHK